MRKNVIGGLAALGLALGTSAAVQGAPIASDSFDYGPAETVNGSSGGTGWADAWTGTNDVVEGSLSHENLKTSGNKLMTEGANAPSFRTLATTGQEELLDNDKFGRDDTTVWIAFVANSPSGINGSYAGVSLFDGNAEHLFLGDLSNNVNWGFRRTNDAGDSEKFSNTVADAQAHLLVYRIQFLPGDETVDMWVDPKPGQTPSEDDIAATSNRVNNFRFNRIRVQAGNVPGPGTPQKVNIDELRIGTSFEDVAPAAAAPEAVQEAETK